MRTIIRIEEDSTGRLHFRTDLPETMSERECFLMIHQIRMNMMTGLFGYNEQVVISVIRLMALAASMCQSDVEAYIDFMRKICEQIVPAKGKLSGQMVIKVDGKMVS